ncbi:cilia- and flagella-associated protein 299 [Drosophila innubila]|uniref:cilia- and flagella-associated protein 299 n=1 Tax=Drosophila innubila TaxID=198719 RepID=UPI00148DF451|nr:cilia- and flagella-associated protein 299 [Drosophila innubila]
MVDETVDLRLVYFKNYEDYLDSFTTKKDAMYLGNKKIARSIVKLGYRSTELPYEEREFARRTNLAKQSLRPKIMGIQPFSRFMSPDNTDPVLLQFKHRESQIFNKVLSTIVFISCELISGYIDLGMSWHNAIRNSFKHTDWKGIFEGHAKLKPRSYHLSYRNNRNNEVLFNDSDNFKVMHDDVLGMIFMHKGDHKLIPVAGAWNKFSRNVNRSMADSPIYGTVVFYDHVVRKKV